MTVKNRFAAATLVILSGLALVSCVSLVWIGNLVWDDIRQLRLEQRRMAAACREAIEIVPNRGDIIKELPMLSLWYAEACTR